MEPTLEQYLNHLVTLAMEANAPAKAHQMSQKAFEVLKKYIDEKKDAQTLKSISK